LISMISTILTGTLYPSPPPKNILFLVEVDASCRRPTDRVKLSHTLFVTLKNRLLK
jgi:hypothetical protein